MSTPVALFFFNRPEALRRTFAQVRAAAPERLFLVSDGPRDAADEEAIAVCRRIVEDIDWPCTVERDYAGDNLGVGRRVASGISRVFEQVEECIVLEDDCLPHPDFFGFCSTLLERYREDPSVMMVCGTNDLLQWKHGMQDYHYCRYGRVWGWATWRRAWAHYDFDIPSFQDPATRERVRQTLDDERQWGHRLRVCGKVISGKVDTWDYQWFWTRLAQDGHCVVSAANLVSNIGFGPGATHTRRRPMPWDGLPVFPMTRPLRPARDRHLDLDYDRLAFSCWRGMPESEALVALGHGFIEADLPLRAVKLLDTALARDVNNGNLAAARRLAVEQLGRRGGR